MSSSSSSSSSKITLRLRTRDGMKRIEVSPKISAKSLLSEIRQTLGLKANHSGQFSVFRDQRETREVTAASKISDLRHGDILYVLCPSSQEEESKKADGVMTSSLTSSTSSLSVEEELDEVDRELSKMDGKISRPKTGNCRHNDNAQCIHCTPMEPFDPTYHKEKEIKHLSFHAYLRQLQQRDRKFAHLEDISCSIKRGCKDHAAWPDGICSKCQPPAITLNRQKYRHVDNIMFENPNIVESFLGFWRSTGKQRLGFLYGHYEVYKDVPLGIKAVVSAIYEPPQEATRDSITLVKDDDKQELVDDVASKLGLTKIGWIFTDLISQGQGEVKYIRHGESHILSAQECIMAAHFQLLHKNKTRSSPSGSFGSKFVTVLVTGNAQKQIHLEGFQVSNQCMALVRDNCLLPTKDAPELGYVRESSNVQYVPDVFYKETDKYGNDVIKPSRPLPVIYLLVEVTVSHPLEPVYTFPLCPASKTPFPIENRPVEGQLQDFGVLANYRKQFSSGNDDDNDDEEGQVLFFRNFHVLIFLASLTIVPLREHMDPLLRAVKDGDSDVIKAWTKSTQWQTVEQLILYS